MSMETTAPQLEQNPYVKELLDILKTHDPKQLVYLKDMIANTVKIEQQLAAAVVELAVMRQELAVIRDESHPMRTFLKNAITYIQDNIQLLSERLEALKKSIIEGCKNALDSIKERGISALNGIAKYFKVKPALEEIVRVSSQAVKDNDKSINRIEGISKEYHLAGKHIKNIGRALIGKEPISSIKPVGKIAKTFEAPYKAVRVCNLSIRSAAQNALNNLTRLQKIADHPKPMKEQVETAAKQAAKHNARNAPDKAMNASAIEL